MNTQIERKWSTLHDMLAANGLVKIAGDQTIKHISSPEAQKGIGKADQAEVRDAIGGRVASDPGAAIKHTEKVDTPPCCQNLNTDPAKAMASTGSDLKVIKDYGAPGSFPKSAADYRHQLATILHNQNMAKQAAEQPITRAMDVMEKIAALSEKPTEQELAECRDEIVKLASTNPLFLQVRDNIMMRKMAEDIDALAEAEGIDPEQAAQALDAAAEQDPEMSAALEDEANGEAIAELADAEQGAGDLLAGAQEMADNASAVLGQEVTAEDMLDAMDEVEAAAEEMGVPPEALIQAAMEQMQEESGEDVSPEEEAEAQQILDMAAEQGLSPEEVLQMAAEMPDDDGESAETPEAAPEEAAPETADESGEEKTASYKPAATPRAAYVQALVHGN